MMITDMILKVLVTITMALLLKVLASWMRETVLLPIQSKAIREKRYVDMSSARNGFGTNGDGH